MYMYRVFLAIVLVQLSLKKQHGATVYEDSARESWTQSYKYKYKILRSLGLHAYAVYTKCAYEGVAEAREVMLCVYTIGLSTQKHSNH